MADSKKMDQVKNLNDMKLYRRELEITLQDEMHLEVDHYLTPIEITEEDDDLLYPNPISKEQQWKNIGYIRGKKAILSKLK